LFAESGHLFLEYLSDSFAVRQRIKKVRKLGLGGVTYWLAALTNVLILAREEVLAALLDLMVELRGFQPMFLAGRHRSKMLSGVRRSMWS
jgi:hypothetical protein